MMSTRTARHPLRGTRLIDGRGADVSARRAGSGPASAVAPDSTDWYKAALSSVFKAGEFHVKLLIFKDLTMSRVCQVTGKRPVSGNTVSHANNRKRRRFLPNLHRQRFWLEGEKRWVSLRLSTNALRTVDKNGIDAVIAKLRAR